MHNSGVKTLLVLDRQGLCVLHDWQREADQSLGHQLLFSSPKNQEQFDPVLELLETDKNQRSVRIAIDSILQFEQRSIFGEEILFPVLAARLIESLYGMVLAIRLVYIDTPHQY